MYIGFICVAVCFLLHSAFVQSTIIELDNYVDEYEPYCWLYRKGVHNLNSTDCNRPCGGRKRVCVFDFVLEYYSAMGSACGNCYLGVLEDCFHPQCVPGDGTERGIKAINRRHVGPDIQVCYGDLVVVKVQNKMKGSASTIHWHGILQKGTQWMDGVPKVTQCLIPEASSFRYVFPVYDVGTYFYHSHAGLHRDEGIFGALVVRQHPDWNIGLLQTVKDEREHVMILTDYMHDTATMFFPGLPSRSPGILPYSFLINGYGRYRDRVTNETVPTPLATFHVGKGSLYRFRVINAGSMICPQVVQIQNHSMTIVSIDGTDIVPRNVDAFVIFPGERVDFVLNANKTSKSYWIHITGLSACSGAELMTEQLGVLSYDTKSSDIGIYPNSKPPTATNPLPYTSILNHPDCDGTPNNLCIVNLESISTRESDIHVKSIVNAFDIYQVELNFSLHEWTTEELHGTASSPNTKYYSFHQLDRTTLHSGVINNISFIFPDKVSMTNRNKDVPNACTPSFIESNCSDQATCECVHIITLPQRRVVELIFRDVTENPAVPHPFHLHGYKFYVMEMVGQNETLNMTNVQNPNGIPPLKDTVMVKQGGATRVRIYTNNPGDWFIHCHFSWHMETGMAAIIRVQGQVPPLPPDFPKCGSYDPIDDKQCSASPWLEDSID